MDDDFQLFDPDNFATNNSSRHWLRFVVAVLAIVGAVVGFGVGTPELNFATAHGPPPPPPIVPAILGSYVAIALWPRPRWSPELVIAVGTLSVATFFEVGLLTHEVVGHTRHIDGLLGAVLVFAMLVATTFVRPPLAVRELPRKLVVPLVIGLLLVTL